MRSQIIGTIRITAYFLLALIILDQMTDRILAQHTSFGYVHESFIGVEFEKQEQIVRMACESGVRSVRISMFWAHIQQEAPSDNQPFESTIDQNQIALYKKIIQTAWDCGIRDIYVLVTFPPQWVTGFPSSSATCLEGQCRSNNVPYYCLMPFGENNPDCQLDGSWFLPRNNGEDVRKIANYLVRTFSPKQDGPRVRFWGFINESTASRVFWQGGTIENLVETMIKPAAETIKNYDPGLKFVGPDEDRLTGLWATMWAAWKYIDIVSYHAYLHQEGLDGLRREIENLWWIIRSHDTPWKNGEIWITETGSFNYYEPNQAFEVQQILNELLRRSWINRVLLHTLVPSDMPGTSVIWSSMIPKQAYWVFRNFSLSQSRRTRGVIERPEDGIYLPHLETHAGFDTYILVSNSSTRAENVRITYLRQDGTIEPFEYRLPPESRTTFYISNIEKIQGENLSAVVQAINPEGQKYIGAEHAVYYGSYRGRLWRSGRNSDGVKLSPSRCFSEGYTGSVVNFTEYYTLVNPHPFGILVRLEFMFENAPNRTYEVWMEPTSTNTIRTNILVPDATAHGVRVSGFTSNGGPIGIAAERTMEWGWDKREAHSTTGIDCSDDGSIEWYFAEGVKYPGWDTYFTIVNPNDSPSRLVVNYFLENHPTYVENHVVPARARLTLTSPAALPYGGYGLKITSTNRVPVVAERLVYWNVENRPLNWEGGTASIGSRRPATRWILSEGSTSIFKMYILIANPNNAPALVNIRFLPQSGAKRNVAITVKPMQRFTLPVNDIRGMDGIMAFSTEVESDSPIVVERAMYWMADSVWHAGHASMGTITEIDRR